LQHKLNFSMLNCIAVDDEPMALELLEDNISKLPYLKLVATCGDAFEALQVLETNSIDLIFIDIQMPGLTGLAFIKSLAVKPMIILLTAYKQYALDSYDLDVVDYLLKPVALERFIKACNKAKELDEMKKLKQSPVIKPAADYIFQYMDYSQVKIMHSNIIWIEGVGDYIKIHCKNSGKALLIRNTIKTLEQELPAAKFVRIHKSYIVAVDSITAIRKNSVFMHDIELPVGETYREAVDLLTGKVS
jgi:two-component system LytT family response regulator